MIARRLPLVAGTLGLGLFFACAHAWKLAPTLYPVFGTDRAVWTGLLLALLLLGAYASGLPDVPTTRLNAAMSALGSVAFALVGVSLAQLALGAPLLPRLVLAGISIGFVPVALISWNIDNDRIRRATMVAMFIGGAQEHAELQAELVGERVGIELLPFQALDADEVIEAARSDGVGMVILDITSLANDAMVAEVSTLHKEGVRVRTVSLFTEEYLGKIPVADLERMSLLFDIGEIHRAAYVRWKRLIDVGFGLLTVAALVPVAGVVFVGNLFGNRGPLLYRQDRVGKDGAVFSILKFRSMTVSAAGQTNWTVADDPRITPFGSILRRSHLDELPQGWNLLRGDLSIVGPRPEQPHYVESLGEKIPFYDVRHLVRPGLTGWAQVSYPYGADEADAREKLQYDLYYLRRQSPRLDIQVIVRTLRTVVGRTGR